MLWLVHGNDLTHSIMKHLADFHIVVLVFLAAYQNSTSFKKSSCCIVSVQMSDIVSSVTSFAIVLINLCSVS